LKANTHTKQEGEERKNERKEKKEKRAGAICDDKKCPIHGSLKVRGRIFEGRVIKKFKNRVAVEFERMIYVRKYERYKKSRTKIHAHLPACMENDIQIGDLIRIQECRPLSKIIHFVIIKKMKSAGER
jgi:small subunit ribosomal protein S17